MKKLLGILLALALCAGCIVTAIGQEPVTEDLPVLGVSFTYPQEMIDAKGAIGTDGAIPLTDDISYAYWYYAALEPEEFNRLLAEDPSLITPKCAVMFYVFAAGKQQDFAAVNEVTGNALDAESAVQIGQAGDWNFYLYFMPDNGFSDNVAQEYRDELTALLGMKDRIAAAMTCSVPFNTADAGQGEGRAIRFTATDFNGEKISSEEIFAQHEITMVNIWATWCGPCISELGELQKINARFREKDCAILGLLIDSDISAAKELIIENGITYQVLFAPDLFSSIFPYEGVPTSFYVDRDGNILGEAIVGVQTERYEEELDRLLAQRKK